MADNPRGVAPLLQDRIALVTGGGAGIGRAIARAFAREGARVVVAEIDEASGEATAASLSALGGEGHFIGADVMDDASVRAAVAAAQSRWGALDILVNNAYPTLAYPPAHIRAIDENRLRSSLQAGFMAAVAAMREAFPAMRARGYGRIINICSLNGVNAHRYTADYNSTKEALRAYTRTAAAEWAPHGVTANIICPGAATTPYELLADFNPGMAEDITRSNPMGRMGDPEADIAPVAVFLASGMARYVTGNTLYADGGGHINGVPWAPDVGEDPETV